MLLFWSVRSLSSVYVLLGIGALPWSQCSKYAFEVGLLVVYPCVAAGLGWEIEITLLQSLEFHPHLCMKTGEYRCLLLSAVSSLGLPKHEILLVRVCRLALV